MLGITQTQNEPFPSPFPHPQLIPLPTLPTPPLPASTTLLNPSIPLLNLSTNPSTGTPSPSISLSLSFPISSHPPPRLNPLNAQHQPLPLLAPRRRRTDRRVRDRPLRGQGVRVRDAGARGVEGDEEDVFFGSSSSFLV
ncbi:hypothetical protein G7Y79_00018g044860 [Physcia stellaris]|nr:hypothetical protein G7Y79_00018g044860 [Physcia stellaris]